MGGLKKEKRGPLQGIEGSGVGDTMEEEGKEKGDANI